MKAEFSNVGLFGERHYSGLYQQQGRMLVDRDWNELCDILRRLGTVAASEAIGTGVPRHDGLLAPRSPGEPVLAMRNSGGLVAAGGLIGEAMPRTPASDPTLYRNQADLPETVRAAADNATQPLLKLPADGRVFYVDIWERPVAAFEVADLIDPALHGADTCVRSQRMAEIKTAAAADLDAAADPCHPAFQTQRIPPRGDAVFDAKLTPASDKGDACDPCADNVTIVRSVDNLLFRLEVHSVGFDAGRRPNRVVLKLSRTNGSRELRLTDLATLADPAGHSYEFFSNETERLLGMPSDDWADEEFLRGVLDPVDASKINKVLSRVREWDGWCELTRAGATWSVASGRYLGRALSDAGVGATVSVAADGLSMGLADIGLLLTLDLAGRNFLTGDFWLALLRNRAPDDQRVKVISPTPLGVEHRYCILGEGGFDGDTFVFKNLGGFDLRRLQHPSLACLDASDIGYQTDCPSGLFDKSHDTVKKALDQICQIRADQVAFALPCKTSVYGHADPATFHTVADALKLLCDVRANEVSFEPDCKYLDTADTVQKALDLLCRQPADTIPFKPDCKFLNDQKVTDVAAALNALCDRGEVKQDLPFIKGVSWKNDQQMTLKDFASGLTVDFSEDMQPALITSDVFVVTFELALDLPQKEVDAPAYSYLLTPQILVGDIETKASATTFTPRKLDPKWIDRLVSEAAQSEPGFAGIRCRLSLSGRAVFAKMGSRPLDGYVPMAPNGKQIDLDFKSPRLGQVSDFDSWFYVVP